MSRLDSDALVAAVEMIGRTGATAFEIVHDDVDDEWEKAPPGLKPEVRWTATAVYRGAKQWHTALGPQEAVEGLLRLLVGGGGCVHCGRPTKVTEARAPGWSLHCGYYREGRRYVRSCATPGV